MYAHQLLGKSLQNNWTVVEKPQRGQSATGGKFSVGYIVQNSDGRRGFLKALDYSVAFQPGQSPALALQPMVDAFNFEREVCERCRQKTLDRVLHAIESGTVQVVPNDPFSSVDYLIFDLAQGDVRKVLDAQQIFDVAFALRTLHHTGVGLHQLHSADMAHQDLKPSNVLVFPGDEGSRIADLGRAWVKDRQAVHDVYPIAGDPNYAPPEFILNSVPADYPMRRFGCDLYLLGSMTVFFFARVSMRALMDNQLAKNLRASHWNGSYAAFLPYLQAAFAEALDEFGDHVPEPFRADIVEVVRQLCEPDPQRRGHPLDRNRSPHSLERYISTFNALAHKAEIQMMRGVV